MSRHKPSVDFLFQSVASVIGSKAMGVILTGMGSDGAKGLLEMKRKVAKTIGQDEESCVVYGMPRIAYEMGAVDKVASLSEIPRLIIKLLERK
jgi:two-component system chemotaxis response regulator CheB